MTILLILLLGLAGDLAAPRHFSGDAEFAQMDYTHAESEYDSASTLSADSAQYLWRLARLYVCRGDVAEHDKKEEIYRAAAEFALRCIRSDSTLAPGHTWRAAALGNLAMFEGSKAKVRLCTEIKHELDRAVSLDSLDDVAYSIMGSFYIALGKVSWIERQLAAIFLGSLPEGGFPEAEAALTRAVRIAPQVIRHRYEMGLLYVEEGREKEAREEFQLASTLPLVVASDERTRSRALEWIIKLSEE
ncbi:MAG TPA: hypothetical protein VL126_04730 [Bacteroidota bacterium]|nr:hypothetical protein [Bacteroidota bacterium]